MPLTVYDKKGIFEAMQTTFEALSHQLRLDILERLRRGPCSVTDLVAELGVSQPLVSKHLRVLRDAGLVAASVDGQRRWYRLEPTALARVASWLEPYRWMWEDRLDALGDRLDQIAAQEEDR